MLSFVLLDLIDLSMTDDYIIVSIRHFIFHYNTMVIYVCDYKQRISDYRQNFKSMIINIF